MDYFPSPADWRDQFIYQIFTDRFDNGDPSLDTLHPTARIDRVHPKGLRGGDFPGIERRLDYISGLGATAIWISPVFLNDDYGAYHGYTTCRFGVISPHLGGLAGLKSLIRAAHARGIYVLLDIVCNHMGRRITSSHPDWPRYRPPPRGYRLKWIDARRKYAPPFNRLRYFHNHGRIGRFTGDELILGALQNLDDLKTELPEVRSYLIDVYRRLIVDTDCDGFRIDTVRHVEDEFWDEFCPAMRDAAASIGKERFLLLGEVFTHENDMIARFLGRPTRRPETTPRADDGGERRPLLMDSVTDFPLYYAMRDALLGRRPPAVLEDRLRATRAYDYDTAYVDHLCTFLDNHDVPRFLWRGYARMSHGERITRLRLALAVLFTWPGLPCVYAGTEQAFHGGHDPLNREEMGAHFDPTHPMYRWIRRLTELRRSAPSLRRGGIRILRTSRHRPGVLAFARTMPGDATLVVLNTSARPQAVRHLPTPFAAGTRVHDRLGAARPALVGPDGRIPLLRLRPLQCRIYAPHSARLLIRR
jgi:glycosidase